MNNEEDNADGIAFANAADFQDKVYALDYPFHFYYALFNFSASVLLRCWGNKYLLLYIIVLQ